MVGVGAEPFVLESSRDEGCAPVSHNTPTTISTGARRKGYKQGEKDTLRNCRRISNSGLTKMEPVSTAASLVTLTISLASVARGIRKVLALKGAPQILQQIDLELSEFRIIIAAIEEDRRQQEALLGVPSPNQHLATAVSLRAKEAILDLEKVVAYRLLKTPTHNDPKIDYRSWLHTEKLVHEMRERLKQIRLDLLVAFNVENLQWRTNVQCSLKELRVGNDRVHEMVAGMMRPPETPQENTQAAGLELQKPPSASMIHMASTTMARKTHILSQFGLCLSPRLGCEISCRCVCHKKNYWKSPLSFNRLLGSLLIGYDPLPTACDYSQCTRKARSMTVVSYTFPRWCIDRILSITVQNPGADVRFRVLRVRPNESEIFSAVECHDTDKVRELLTDGRATILDVNEDGESLLTIALTIGRTGGEFLHALASFGVDVHQEDTLSMSAYLYFWTPMLLGQDSWSQYRYLFGYEAQLDRFGFTPLHASILGLDSDTAGPETISTTPRNDIDEVDRWGRSALSWACARGDRNKIERLMLRGADPDLADGEGRTPLHNLANSSNERSLSLLLENGGNVHAKNRRGGTPLHDFTFQNTCTRKILACFVDHGADLDASDGGGWTAMHWVVRSGNIAMIDAFIERGANIECSSRSGATPLTYALSRQQYDAFKHLFQAGADSLVKSQKGSLLHFVARDVDIDTVRYLRGLPLHNVDMDIRDEDGFTALERAERRRDGIIEYTERGAKEIPVLTDRGAWFEAFLSLAQGIDVQTTGRSRRLQKQYGGHSTAYHESFAASTNMSASQSAEPFVDILSHDSGTDPDVFVDADERLSSLQC